MAYMFDYQNRWSDDPDSSLPLGKRYAEQAIEQNPKEPLARLVAAWAAIYEKDLDRAKSEAENALSLNPNLAMAYNTLGGIRSYSGQPLEAIPMIERAMRLEPASNLRYVHFLGMAYLWLASTNSGEPSQAASFLDERRIFHARCCFRSGASRRARRGPSHLARAMDITRNII